MADTLDEHLEAAWQGPRRGDANGPAGVEAARARRRQVARGAHPGRRAVAAAEGDIEAALAELSSAR